MTKPIKLNLRAGRCPTCDLSKRKVVHELNYQDVHLAVPEVEDFRGKVRECSECGLYLVEPRYDEEQFALIYKNLSRKGQGSSVVKHLASFPLEFAMTGWFSRNPLRKSLARLVGTTLDPVLHMPLPTYPLPKRPNILDIGCGDGFHLRCFSSLGANLYATEIHPGYAAYLERGPERIRHWIKEFTKIDWERETGFGHFDLIILQSVFYRLNNPWESLDMAWKLLRPGGTILRIEPFCSDVDAGRFITRFNFPQGFSFVHDRAAYERAVKKLYPEAQMRWKIFYGRSWKLEHGRDLTPLLAVRDILTRLYKTVARKQPYYIKLEMHKPAAAAGAQREVRVPEGEMSA